MRLIDDNDQMDGDGRIGTATGVPRRTVFKNHSSIHEQSSGNDNTKPLHSILKSRNSTTESHMMDGKRKKPFNIESLLLRNSKRNASLDTLNLNTIRVICGKCGSIKALNSSCCMKVGEADDPLKEFRKRHRSKESRASVSLL